MTENIQNQKLHFLEGNSEIARSIRSNPQISMEVPPGRVSLKDLFHRVNMDRWHVDGTLLKKYGISTMKLMESISRAGICPGLIALEDLYVDPEDGLADVVLVHPEKFQLNHMPQDYEWYPEDERILGDIELFDVNTQRKADLRLLYRILIGSSRGNVRIPPKETDADYGVLFYHILPADWVALFQKVLKEGVSLEELGADEQFYQMLIEGLIETVSEEEGYMRRSLEGKKPLPDSVMEERAKVEDNSLSNPEDQAPCLQKRISDTVLYILLRTEIGNCRRMSRMIYECQTEAEERAEREKRNLRQAFVYGDGNVMVRRLSSYARGFRAELEPVIRDYSMGEAMIAGADQAAGLLQRKEGNLHVFILVDGRMANDDVFQYALNRWTMLPAGDMNIHLRTVPEAEQCEAVRLLRNFLQ